MKKIKEIIEQKALGKLAMIKINVHGTAYAHALDLLSYFGNEIKAISGSYKNDDSLRFFGGTDWSLYDKDILYVPSISLSVTAEFENGVIGNVTSSIFYNLHAFVMSIEAVFENGVLTLNGINMFNSTGHISYQSKYKIRAVNINHKKGVYAKGFEYSFYESIKNFMENYIKDEPPETPGKTGLYNIVLDKAIYCTRSVR